jgi:DNA-binding CsgD family transcriptional regulator
MKKFQKLHIRTKKNFRGFSNYEMSEEDHHSLENQLYKDWLIGDDYGTRREELQRLIETVYSNLSPREKQVFQLLSEKATEEQSAAILKVSRSLIKQARKRIINKFKENLNGRDKTSMFVWR